MKKYIAIFMLVAAICFVGCGKKEDDSEKQASQQKDVFTLMLGTPAAALNELEWIKGDSVTFEAGHVYVIEFWATWCPPCLVSIPHLTGLQEEYKDKVTIVGISVDKDEQENANQATLEMVKQFVGDKGKEMEYIVAYDLKGNVDLAYRKNIPGIPRAFIVDQAGKIAWVGHPMAIDDALKGIVEGE